MGDFDKFDRRADRVMRIAIGAWILYVLVILALLIGGGFIGWHFLQKVW